MPIAVNPSTGEALTLNGDQWVPAKIAVNPQTGEKLALDGAEWKPIGAAPKAEAPPEAPRVSGSILPFSNNQEGTDLQFDSNAGLFGAIKRPIMGMKDIIQGKTNPYSEQGRNIAFEAAMLGSPVTPGLNSGEKLIPGVAQSFREAAKEVPTAQALKDSAEQGYTAVRNMNVDYNSKSVADMANGLQQALNKDGFIADIAPGTHKVLDGLTNPPAGSTVSMQSLDAARQILNRTIGKNNGVGGNSQEVAAAQQAINAIDGFISKADPASVVAGPAAPKGTLIGGGPLDPAQAANERAAAAARILQDARGDYAAAKRSDRITGDENLVQNTGVLDRAETNAAAANSGRNIDNSIRQQLKAILNNPKQARGFSQEELAAIKEVAEGTPSTNALRYVGNLLGGGGGLGAAITGGAGGAMGGAVGGLPGAVLGATPAVVGFGAKSLSNSIARRNAEKLAEMLRRRSPMYENITPEMIAGLTPTQQTMARLLAGGANQGDQ